MVQVEGEDGGREETSGEGWRRRRNCKLRWDEDVGGGEGSWRKNGRRLGEKCRKLEEEGARCWGKKEQFGGGGWSRLVEEEGVGGGRGSRLL